jgi:hypothetical protein
MATSEWVLPPQFENGIMLEDLLSTADSDEVAR